MDAHAPQILVALEASGLGLAIRQSVWAYPAANVGHVVSVAGFFAAVTVLDLALLGAIPGGAALAARARLATIALFALVAATGSVLFIAEASHLALNRVFQVKVLIIALALANALWLGRKALSALAAAGDAAPTPHEARFAASASLVFWLVAIALGRFIAYA